jgi:hypothetical protein
MLTPVEAKYVISMIAHTREDIGRADTKASILLAALGVVGGSLTSAVLARSWSPDDFDIRVSWLWWASVGIFATALGALGYALYPRMRNPKGKAKAMTFFGDVLDIPKADLEASIAAAATEGIGLLTQLLELADIAHRKYRAVQLALWSVAAATAMMLAAIMLNSQLK